MNAKEAIQLAEARTPEGWGLNPHGIYGNFSNWPHEVKFYVKCPVCGLVHGDFKSLRDAHSQKLCSNCNRITIDKLKDEIKDVVTDPEHKPKEMAKLMGEAIDTFDPFDTPPEAGGTIPPEDEPDLDPADTKGEIERLLLGNWVDVALRLFASEESYTLTDLTIDERWSERNGNYDPANLGDTTAFKIEIGDKEWAVFKSEEEAEAYALIIIRNDLETEPELFTQDWLRSFVDENRLRDSIGDPYEDWDEEVRNLDYEELLQKMVDEDFLYPDDTFFFRLNGDPRVATPKREAALNAKMEEYIEQKKPKIEDPWAWYEDVYGDEEAIKQAIEAVGFDVDKAAASALQADGWSHFVNHYDRNSSTLENGAVYCRI
jgi:hypothetical protein